MTDPNNNIAAETISIDDAAAVLHFVLQEVFFALAPEGEGAERLIDFTNRLLEASDQMTIPKRRALMKAIAIYLTACEPSGI